MKNSKLLWAIMAFLLLAYGYEAYVLERYNFIGLLGIYTAIWVFTLGMLIQCSHKYLLAFAFAVRFLIILAIPNLSQDFYRFIWDGKLLALGYNPYLYLPIDVIKDPSFLISNGLELYQGMGALSAGHYTNYPPLNQLCFWLAALLGNGSIMQSVVVLRLIIIAADYGIYVYGSKILQKMSLPRHNIYWYLLNPLVIIELTGNLHFEGVMMFFFITSLFWLTNERLGRSALGFSASVLIKLVPLLFAPFIANHLRLHKASKFAAIAFLVLFLGFLPFLNIHFVQHYQATVSLWFVNFEFNASIYYLVRYWGFMHYGYNIIGTYGQVLPFVIIAIMGYFSFFRANLSLIDLMYNLLLAMSCYFLVATTVHPWYIVTLVLLSVFTQKRFALLWSYTIIMSYAAYSGTTFTEQNAILVIEYAVLILFVLFENRIRSSECFIKL